MGWSEKVWFVEQVADLQAHIFRQSFESTKFRSIGTVSPHNQGDSVSNMMSANVKPGRMVSRIFFWGDHFKYDIARGPYRSSCDWLAAFLALLHQGQAGIIERIQGLETPQDDEQEQKQEAQRSLKVLNKLESLLPSIFPRLQAPAERTVLWHDDLSLMNILVDDGAKTTAVTDWECVSTKPLWAATEMPKFLLGPDREEEAQKDDYADETESERGSHPDSDEDEIIDNQGKTDLYWLNWMEYDQTQLRKVYSARLLQLWPQWGLEAEDSIIKADFYEAVERIAGGWNFQAVSSWADAVEHWQSDSDTSEAFPRLKDFLKPTGLLSSR
ncbi:hypothetical protein QBC44DRAFT_363927 [Cladorrhinum sp. PSN332]|nr:hypothetical protein QBC44DRAFT_363927 [Cladorrhinum sp. PSN332]